MSDRLRVGRFVASLERYPRGEYRYYARHSITGRCRCYGLSQLGYESARAALVAMNDAERAELANDPTEDMECAKRSEVTERLEVPHGR